MPLIQWIMQNLAPQVTQVAPSTGGAARRRFRWIQPPRRKRRPRPSIELDFLDDSDPGLDLDNLHKWLARVAVRKDEALVELPPLPPLVSIPPPTPIRAPEKRARQPRPFRQPPPRRDARPPANAPVATVTAISPPKLIALPAAAPIVIEQPAPIVMPQPEIRHDKHRRQHLQHLKPSRKLIAKLRRRAPKHPRGPEAQLRLALARLFIALNRTIRAQIRKVAIGLIIRNRHDAKGDATLRSALATAHQHGRQLLHSRGFQSALSLAAARTASDAASQTKKALGKFAPKEIPDLGDQAQAFRDRVFEAASDLVDDAIDRADGVVGEWLDLDPDRSERAEDIDALDDMIAEDQDKNTSKALMAGALAFGAAFAVMIRAAQENADVGSYMWLTSKDSRVRPEHADLDEQIASWDDPPLTADKSDNEEDDHPGEDYNCRCVASPLTPDDLESLS